MKTNVNMVRKMGEFEVVQRTKDGYFNATHLFNQWNKKYPNERRQIDNFWKSTNLEDLMREIVENEPEFNTVDSTDYNTPNLGIINQS